jgi:hypothetical protein
MFASLRSQLVKTRGNGVDENYARPASLQLAVWASDSDKSETREPTLGQLTSSACLL